MTDPVVREHAGISVVREDLYPGGTKARFFGPLCEQHAEMVYATPAQGGAQTALAHAAAAAGKRATIFVAKRQQPHDRAREAKRVGATVVQVRPGHLSVVQARAREYCAATGAYLIPFGADLPEAAAIIAAAARATALEPDEVWCAAGSGVLTRALQLAWPGARFHAVQIGRQLQRMELGVATVHVWPKPFDEEGPPAPFPADLHYDAKAWAVCAKERGPGRVVFWNVTGPAVP